MKMYKSNTYRTYTNIHKYKCNLTLQVCTKFKKVSSVSVFTKWIRRQVRYISVDPINRKQLSSNGLGSFSRKRVAMDTLLRRATLQFEQQRQQEPVCGQWTGFILSLYNVTLSGVLRPDYENYCIQSSSRYFHLRFHEVT